MKFLGFLVIVLVSAMSQQARGARGVAVAERAGSGRRHGPPNYPPPGKYKSQEEPGMKTWKYTPKRTRSTRSVFTFHTDRGDDCDYSGLRCMRAYKTGLLCARTTYFTYDTFRNACEMDYVNCVIGHERWMVVHMGPCVENNKLNLNEDGDETYRSREDFINNDYVHSEQGT